MSGNTLGTLFTVTTFGESHGPALGCVVDGCPPGLALSEDLIQPFLDKRKPGQSQFTTQRREEDVVQILSGVFEGKTTGTPIIPGHGSICALAARAFCIWLGFQRRGGKNPAPSTSARHLAS